MYTTSRNGVLYLIHELFGNIQTIDDITQKGAIILHRWPSFTPPAHHAALLIAMSKEYNWGLDERLYQEPDEWAFSDTVSDEFVLIAYKGVQVLVVIHYASVIPLELCWLDNENMTHLCDIYNWTAVRWPFSQPFIGLQNETDAVEFICKGEDYNFYGDSAYAFRGAALKEYNEEIYKEVIENRHAELLLYPKEEASYPLESLQLSTTN